MSNLTKSDLTDARDHLRLVNNRVIVEIPFTTPEITVELDAGAKLLDMKLVNGVPTLFAITRTSVPDAELLTRRFIAIPGGAILNDKIDTATYLGTLAGNAPGSALHFFEVGLLQNVIRTA